MRTCIPPVALIAMSLAASAVSAEELPDLKVTKVEIVPNSARDLNDPFFRGRPILEVAPATDEHDEPLQLPTYRSYRFIVTVQLGQAKAPESFLVKTECIRDGKTTLLGKTRIGLENRRSQYACYDVFPAEAGPGECLIRTVVEADTSGESHEFRAMIVK